MVVSFKGTLLADNIHFATAPTFRFATHSPSPVVLPSLTLLVVTILPSEVGGCQCFWREGLWNHLQYNCFFVVPWLHRDEVHERFFVTQQSSPAGKNNACCFFSWALHFIFYSGFSIDYAPFFGHSTSRNLGQLLSSFFVLRHRSHQVRDREKRNSGWPVWFFFDTADCWTFLVSVIRITNTNMSPFIRIWFFSAMYLPSPGLPFPQPFWWNTIFTGVRFNTHPLVFTDTKTWYKMHAACPLFSID